MRTPLLIIAAFLTTGCITTSKMTIVNSEPKNAMVTVEGYGQCETPCTIKLDQPRLTTVAKAGYEKQRFMLIPGRPKVDVILKLAAPTKEIESSELPEL